VPDNNLAKLGTTPGGTAIYNALSFGYQYVERCAKHIRCAKVTLLTDGDDTTSLNKNQQRWQGKMDSLKSCKDLWKVTLSITSLGDITGGMRDLADNVNADSLRSLTEDTLDSEVAFNVNPHGGVCSPALRAPNPVEDILAHLPVVPNYALQPAAPAAPGERRPEVL